MKMERRLAALHLSIVSNRGFYSVKSLAQALCGFARGKNIQNNAAFADHTEPLRLSYSPFGTFCIFFLIFSLPYFFIITKKFAKCKGRTKKTSTFFFVIFSQQNDNFVI